ncbi:MAG: class I SAM-dependent methyltransferase [Micromonosporaceae bacterium]|nr:class I SAM-dependent methyltransferase [Micromonosporaceae bacterium]
MEAGRESRTAVLTCQARAAADGLLVADRFSDPVAIELLAGDERAVVRQVRDQAPPRRWSERMGYEVVRVTTGILVARTVAIDDAIRDHTAPQLVILGGGLDARAWRMPQLSTVDVFEVDHPASQQDKRDRIGDRAPLAKSVRFVPVDFARGRLDAALESAGHRADQATVWVWEAVVQYLRNAEVVSTVQALAGRSAPGSRLIVNYASPTLTMAISYRAESLVAAVVRRRSLLEHEPRRSTWTPAAMAELLSTNGFTVVRDEALLTIAGGLSIPVAHRGSMRSSRVAIADRTA